MIFVALFACAPDAIDSADSATDSATDSAADTATDTGDSADTGAVATHYFGESQGQTPDGSYVAEPEAILFIRTLDPVASTITEEVWVEGRPKWTHYLLVHEVDAAAGTFTSEWVTADGTLDVVGATTRARPGRGRPGTAPRPTGTVRTPARSSPRRTASTAPVSPPRTKTFTTATARTPGRSWR